MVDWFRSFKPSSSINSIRRWFMGEICWLILKIEGCASFVKNRCLPNLGYYSSIRSCSWVFLNNKFAWEVLGANGRNVCSKLSWWITSNPFVSHCLVLWKGKDSDMWFIQWMNHLAHITFDTSGDRKNEVIIRKFYHRNAFYEESINCFFNEIKDFTNCTEVIRNN